MAPLTTLPQALVELSLAEDIAGLAQALSLRSVTVPNHARYRPESDAGQLQRVPDPLRSFLHAHLTQVLPAFLAHEHARANTHMQALFQAFLRAFASASAAFLPLLYAFAANWRLTAQLADDELLLRAPAGSLATSNSPTPNQDEAARVISSRAFSICLTDRSVSD